MGWNSLEAARLPERVLTVILIRAPSRVHHTASLSRNEAVNEAGELCEYIPPQIRVRVERLKETMMGTQSVSAA
jgi:hypothetical protein